MQGCLGKPKVVKIDGRLQWKCSECKEVWKVAARHRQAALLNLRLQGVQYDLRKELGHVSEVE